MRRPIATLVAVILALCIAAPALGAREAQRNGARATAGIDATGTGAVLVRGRVLVIGEIPGPGSITLTDFAGDAVIRIDGALKRIPPRTGFLRISRATGRIYVEGSAVRVRIVGAGLALTIVGRGRATLAGVGDYRLNDGPSLAWPGLGQPVLLEPPRADTVRIRRRAARE